MQHAAYLLLGSCIKFLRVSYHGGDMPAIKIVAVANYQGHEYDDDANEWHPFNLSRRTFNTYTVL